MINTENLERLKECLIVFGIEPDEWLEKSEYDRLNELAKVWNKFQCDNKNRDNQNNKQQMWEIQKQIKHSKNPMEKISLQKRIG